MEVLGSGKVHFFPALARLLFTCDIVFSLIGVVLIARPPFLFGDHSGNGLGQDLLSERNELMGQKEIVTPGKRLLAVW